MTATNMCYKKSNFGKKRYSTPLKVLASHNTSLGSVAQGALELESWEIRKCHFLSDPCVFGYIF